MHYVVSALVVVSAALACSRGQAETSDYFCIKIVDEATGRGVPLVELKTVNDIRYYTDSAGIVAFNEPGLMGQLVFFHVQSHGYEYPKDGFGYRGARLKVVPGGTATLKIKRINIAERLYRVTGAGIYRDSVLVGKSVPVAQPVLNGRVLGSDSVVNAVCNDRLYWFWGDTNRPSYPLGNFHVPGAVSMTPSQGGLDPERGVDLKYFVNADGFASATAELPGAGPTWINGLVTLDGGDGRDTLYAAYVKIEPPLKVYERGIARFDEATHRFDKFVELELDAPLYPHGHPIKAAHDGVEYLHFADPFPLVRVRATLNEFRDPTRYEAYTCLQQGCRADSIKVARQDGAPVYGWKKDTIPYTPRLQNRLIRDGHLTPHEALFRLTTETGKPVTMHRGSVNWNDYRQRWIMIGVESGGTSALGEVWYAEAPHMVGPWDHARKIATHNKYSFYNPKQHPVFDKHGGKVIFFEGTYTNTFSGNRDSTPRYNYNQVMYKLDLSDPRLR